MVNSWERLGIDQSAVDKCNKLAETLPGEKSRKYWTACSNFIKSIEYTSFSDLVVSQRNWARNIVKDLIAERLK